VKNPPKYHNKQLIHEWTYRVKDGTPLGTVGRYEDETGKKVVVPFFNKGNGSKWQPGIGLNPRPLFGLELLSNHPPERAVFIAEGEKAAAALQGIGCTALTSLGGSSAANKADWTPLNGFQNVIIWPDNDDPGLHYAEDVYRSLQKLTNPPSIKLLQPEDLPKGGDVVDWLQGILPEWNGYASIPQNLHQAIREDLADELENAKLMSKDWDKNEVNYSYKKLFTNNPTLPTHSAMAGGAEDFTRHSSDTNTAFKGKLTTENPKTGNIKLIIESKAALILAQELRQILGYSSSAGAWHKFTGTRWQELSGGKKETAEQFLQKWIYQGCEPIGFRPTYQKNIMTLLADGRQLPLSANESNLLPFKNGLLDIETKTLIKITPQNAQTWVLPYEYAPHSDCPKIKAWLNQVTGHDTETVEFLRAWFAALIHGRADLHKFLHLLGSGGTGKSTLIRLAESLIGKHNTIATSLEQMEKGQFETSNYYEKRLIVITDSDNYGGSVDKFKAITGQDPVRMERKYQQSGTFTFDGLVLVASNQAITTTDHTSGLERRRLTVNFDYVFTEEEKANFYNSGGEKALHTELPGFVNWLLELSQHDISRLMRHPPMATIRANIEAKKADNSVFAWLLECCIPDQDAATQVGVKQEIRESGQETCYENNNKWLYANYLQWASRASRKPHSVRKFSDILLDTLKSHGVRSKKGRSSSGRFISGVRLSQEWDAEKTINGAWKHYLY